MQTNPPINTIITLAETPTVVLPSGILPQGRVVLPSGIPVDPVCGQMEQNTMPGVEPNIISYVGPLEEEE